ncbi:hypothetical protein ACFX15_022174 [Malus domestica]
MDYGWCRGTARLGDDVWVLCGRCGDEEWRWKSAEMEEKVRQGFLVMVAAARWGKGDGFLIFMEREEDLRLGW